jgi:hypothetical protein
MSMFDLTDEQVKALYADAREHMDARPILYFAYPAGNRAMNEHDEPARLGQLPQPGELWSLLDLAKQTELLKLMSIGEGIALCVQFYRDAEGSLSEESAQEVKETIEQMAEYCGIVGVKVVESFLLKQVQNIPADESHFNLLIQAFVSGLTEQLVLILDSDSRHLFQSIDLFGVDVSAAFPSSVPEIRDGATCLALGQPTAAVFHFLRALEPPIKALATEFGISKFTDWNSALNDIEDAVRDRTNPQTRPNWADEKDDYTEMVSHLFVVKNAWRNYTMHLKLRHTDEEAREIMAAAKSFMRRAAKRVKE